MNTGKLVVPREYGIMMSRFAPISIISSIYALYMNQEYSIAVGPFSIACTTYLYWHNPTYSWRRNLDIFTVGTMFSYQVYRAIGAEYVYYCYLCHTLGITSYLLGVYYGRNNIQLGMIFHTGVHILLNMGSIFLFSGKIL